MRQDIEIELSEDKVLDYTCDGIPCYGGTGIVSLDSDGNVTIEGWGQDQDGGDHNLGDITDWYSDSELKKLYNELIEIDPTPNCTHCGNICKCGPTADNN